MAGLERSELLTQIHRLYRDGTSAFESDGQLLDRYLTMGDESAFETIVDRHGPLVLSLCRRFLRDRCDVEDAFQATFLILARKASSIRNRPALSSWLYGVACKVAIRARGEMFRRREREATGLDVDPVASSRPDADDLGPAIDEELSRLPEKFRAPIVLCYLKEQTHDQAAAELRWPVGTVRSRLARGRSLLRDRLIRRGCSPVASLIGLAPGGLLGRFTIPVPAPLIASTVAAAARFAAAAGSSARPFLFSFLTSTSTPTGSATTLAQGVLATMTFTPIKLVAAGLTAGVLVGGLGTGAYTLRPAAAGQQKAGAPVPIPRPEPEKADSVRPEETLPPPTILPQSEPLTPRSDPRPQMPPQANAPTPRSDPRFVVNDPGIDARLTALERKLDLLLERLPRPDAPPLNEVPALRGNRPITSPQPLEGPAADNEPALSRIAPDVPELEERLPRAQRSDPSLSTVRLPNPESPAQVQGGARQPTRVRAPSMVEESPSNLAPSMEPQAASRSPFEQDAPASMRPAGTVQSDRDTWPRTSPSTSFREIEAAIRNGLAEIHRCKQLYLQGSISAKECEAPAEQVQILLGRLRGIQEELGEQAEQQGIEIRRAQSELDLVRAEQKAAEAPVSKNQRLLKLNGPGMVSTEDAARAESELAAATARVEIRQASLAAAQLRSKQIGARVDAVRAILNSAEKQLNEAPGMPRATPGDRPTR
ncbi:sigma-70 family RNA polymerase sigma factor [Aquisphaera insulae]|uniref:sigma-70 family RNA polymerase sigma factor n=1 Tax=Aquisphaera insulae TaxID=2712864 RepID=UPI0013EC723F|nr:sigma-70 family RNA polymerase sigma factor [Aquisphaera insulae]